MDTTSEPIAPAGLLPPLPLPPLPLGAAHYVYPSPEPTAGGSGKPRVWTVFVTFVAALVVFILVSLIGAAIVAVLSLRNRDDIQSVQAILEALPTALVQPGALISLFLAGQITLLVCAIAAAILSPVPFTKRLRLTRSSLPIVAYPLVMIGALAVGLLYSQLIDLLHLKPNGTLKILDDLLHNLSPAQTTAAVLVLGIMPGFAEEWLFRGYIQTRLSRAWGRWVAIGVTALLFGIMHMDLWQSPFAVLFGVYLGYVAEKTGSIRPTMICHMFNNSAQILMVTVLAPFMTPALEWGLLTCCLVGLPASIVYLRFWVQPAEDEEAVGGFPPIVAPPAAVGF